MYAKDVRDRLEEAERRLSRVESLFEEGWDEHEMAECLPPFVEMARGMVTQASIDVSNAEHNDDTHAFALACEALFRLEIAVGVRK